MDYAGASESSAGGGGGVSRQLPRRPAGARVAGAMATGIEIVSKGLELTRLVSAQLSERFRAR
jgi:hypothetical protein